MGRHFFQVSSKKQEVPQVILIVINTVICDVLMDWFLNCPVIHQVFQLPLQHSLIIQLLRQIPDYII